MPPSAVGLRKGAVYSSLPTDLQNCLSRFNDWFDGLEDYRHASAHRIPLYVPPFTVNPANEEPYNDFEAQKAAAMRARDFTKYHKLDAEQQQSLGKFLPIMVHSHVEGRGHIYFHAQVLADWNTVVEIAETFLRQFGE